MILVIVNENLEFLLTIVFILVLLIKTTPVRNKVSLWLSFMKD